jgi:hypothetical protein
MTIFDGYLRVLWWSRVWTLQEAVLPAVDPIVHASPFSFRILYCLTVTIRFLSTRLGIAAKIWEDSSMWRTSALFRFSNTEPILVYEHREVFSQEDPL